MALAGKPEVILAVKDGPALEPRGEKATNGCGLQGAGYSLSESMLLKKAQTLFDGDLGVLKVSQYRTGFCSSVSL